jgi:hypothetical protein
MSRRAYAEIASSFDLWQDYIDPNATTSRAEFDAMSHADRVALIVETFGPEPEPVPTVEQVLADTAIGCGLHRWAVEGGSIQLSTDQLHPCLEEAYDWGGLGWLWRLGGHSGAADPDWVALVDAEAEEVE